MSNGNELGGFLSTGILQGLKAGMSFARMESGLKKGYNNGIRRHDRVQDPTVGLLQNKEPEVFWLADYCATSTFPPTNGSNVTSIYNLVNTAQNLTIAQSPIYRSNGVYNNRGYVDFNTGNDIAYTPVNYTGTKELTVTMLVRFSSLVTNRVLFYRVFSTGANTVGDIQITVPAANKIRASMYGNAGTLSVYETFYPGLDTLATVTNGTNNNEWFLVTVKFDLNQKYGPGSEIEIFINGMKNQLPITTTFTPPSVATNMPNTFMSFGNNAPTSITGGGSQIAGAIVFDYILSNMEQIRIENFFRYYYGRRF